MAYAFPPRTPQQLGANEANLDTMDSSDSVLVDHALVSIVGEEGIGGGGAITVSRTLYLNYPSLDTKPAPDPSDEIAIYDPVTEDHNRITISSLVLSGGGAVLKYVNNDCLITASNTGVTVSKNAATGVITITVPATVHLYAVNINAEQADTDDYQNLYIKVVYQTESTINQDLPSTNVPHVTYVNTSYTSLNSGVVSESYPAPYDSTKNILLTLAEPDGADAVIQIKIESIVEDTFIVKLTF